MAPNTPTTADPLNTARLNKKRMLIRLYQRKANLPPAPWHLLADLGEQTLDDVLSLARQDAENPNLDAFRSRAFR